MPHPSLEKLLIIPLLLLTASYPPSYDIIDNNYLFMNIKLSISKTTTARLSRQSSAKDCTSNAGVQVQSLVGELRSHMPQPKNKYERKGKTAKIKSTKGRASLVAQE